MKQYAVVKMNAGQKNFSTWHEDLETARLEAERLCRKESSYKFAVLEIVGVCEMEVPVPPVVWRTV